MKQVDVAEDKLGDVRAEERTVRPGLPDGVFGDVGRGRDVGEVVLCLSAVKIDALEYEEVLVYIACVDDLQLQQITLRTSFDVRVGYPLL